VNVGGSICKGVVVDSNIILCNSNVWSAITLVGDSSSNGFSDFSIKGNIINNFMNGNTSFAAITIDRSTNFNVSNNVIHEGTPVTPSTNAAIKISNAVGFNITGNSTLGVDTTSGATRASVIFDGTVEDWTITGNTFKWSDDPAGAGQELYLDEGSFGMISGNHIQGSTNLGVRYAIKFTAAADSVYITSNFFKGTYNTGATQQITDGGASHIESIASFSGELNLTDS
jgi:hypothetical protein